MPEPESRRRHHLRHPFQPPAADHGSRHYTIGKTHDCPATAPSRIGRDDQPAGYRIGYRPNAFSDASGQVQARSSDLATVHYLIGQLRVKAQALLRNRPTSLQGLLAFFIDNLRLLLQVDGKLREIPGLAILQRFELRLLLALDQRQQGAAKLGQCLYSVERTLMHHAEAVMRHVLGQQPRTAPRRRALAERRQQIPWVQRRGE